MPERAVHLASEGSGAVSLREIARCAGVSHGAPRRYFPIVAGALWANLHGIAQLWGWGSLQLATGLTDPGPLLQAALDAHLGPER